MTFKFDGWPQNTIGQLVHATFVNYFKAIGKFNFDVESGNA